MAEYVELTIDQGATYNNTISVTDANGAGLNLTGYTARSQMRKSYYSSTSYSFTLTFIPELISYSPSGVGNCPSGVVM